MALTLDATSNSGYEPTLSTYNWSHTCNGKDRLLVVGVSILATGNVSTVTYNNVSLTKVRADAGTTYRSEIWYLIAPTVGTNSIAVTLNTSLTSIAGAVSYTGASQIGAIGAQTGTTGTNAPATVSLTTTVPNAFVMDTAAIQTSTVAIGSSGNSRWNSAGALGSGVGGDISVPASGTSQAMSWTGEGIADAWAISAIEIRPQAPDNIFGGSVPSTHISRVSKVIGY